MYGRLSYGGRQQSACLCIHFLTGSPNRSTSCLFPVMLSSRQEITCLYFSHQSFSPLWSVCPLMFASLLWYLSVPLHGVLGLISLLTYSKTTDYSGPSISHQQVLFSHFVTVVLRPNSPLVPDFIWTCHCSFELNENASLQSEGRWCCGIPQLHLWCADKMFCCLKWLYLDTSEADL